MYKQINQIIQEYSEKKYSFITGNGTSAIYLSLKVSDIPKGSKIAVPNISCPDPVYALIWAGYTPVFIDVNIEDYNMNIDKLELELKHDKDIKGIIAIHLFGNSCDIVVMSNLAKEYNCFLLEDCAQSFGNEINEGKLGSFGDVSIFSFGNGKIIEVGHGGSVQSNDKILIDKIKNEYEKLNIFNESKIDDLGKKHRNIYYKLYYLGLKFPSLNILNMIYVYFFKNYYLYKISENKLNSIKLAMDNFKFDRNDRIENIDKYFKGLKDTVSLPTLHNKENILSRLTIVVNEAEKVSKSIRESGISSNTMYPMLVDRFKIKFNKKDFSVSYHLKNRLLNLWVTNVNSKDIEQVIKVLKEV